MTIYSSDIKVDIPLDLNLTELLHSSAQSPPVPGSHIVFEDDLEGRSLSLDGLRRNAGALAHTLHSRYNPRDQSRWALILPNCVTIIEAFHAVLWLGGVVCPINHQLPASDISHALAVTKPEYAIVYAPVVRKVEEAIEAAKRKDSNASAPQIIVVLDESHSHYPTLHQGFSAHKILPVPHYNSTEDRLASIHLSSGTTGLPKGVKLSHLNYVANVYQLQRHDPDRWSPEESVLSITPFVHLANGTIPFFLGPWTGMRHIIMTSFDVEQLGRTVQRTRPTTIQMVPAIARLFFQRQVAKKYDFSSVKRVTGSIGAASPAEVQEYFGPGKWTMMQTYGMTEAACWIAMNRITEHVALTELGPLVPGLEARLMNDDRTEAPVGGPGELWLRGLNMTKGYLDNEKANTEAFPEPKWLNTGDIVSISPQGILKLQGRTKELIKYSGFQVSPSELEQYIARHSAVADCAVTYTLDANSEELPTAYVVLVDDIKESPMKLAKLQEVHESVDSQVAGYKKLRGGVWEVSKIARNPTSKIVRRELRSYITGLASKRDYARSSKI